MLAIVPSFLLFYLRYVSYVGFYFRLVKCFKLFCCRNIVTISTSFEPYLSSLSQNPKYAKACKASMKACQNVTRGILSSALLAEVDLL